MRRIIGIVVLVGLGVFVPPAAAIEQPTKEQCSVSNAAAAAAPGEAIKPAVKLSPEPNSQARVVNFGGDRDPEFQRYTLIADPALPKGAEKQLSLIADVMTRTGDENADTVTFPDPTFTPIVVYGNGKRLAFGVCLTPPKDLPAGHYTSLITTDAPDGIEGTAVSVTANAKDGDSFIYGAIATLVIAFLVLLYKGIAATRAARMEAAKDGEDAAKKAAASWLGALGEQLKDLAWLVATITAIVLTGAVLLGLWAGDPAWGDEGFPESMVALIGAGLAAVGVKTVLSLTPTPPK